MGGRENLALWRKVDFFGNELMEIFVDPTNGQVDVGFTFVSTFIQFHHVFTAFSLRSDV